MPTDWQSWLSQTKSTGLVCNTPASRISASFRRTSAELCTAILGPHEPASTVLRQYLACIEDDRLRRAFAAAIEANQPEVSHGAKPVKRDNGLWKGLPSRVNH
jgi:hypothetical protein